MINIIPTPKEYNIDNEKTVAVKISVYTENEPWVKYCKKFAEDIFNIRGCKVSFEKGGIELLYDKSLKDEEYRIISENGKITAFASTDEGILYALSSLTTFIYSDENNFLSKEAYIRDYPDKSYRGMMVDLAREWHPFDKLSKYIDICYLYKVKYLHLHFADSNLYTLPSNEFPKLCKEDRFYTFSQIEELNSYAKLRGVILVPEFECPGHAPVLTNAYPEIFKDKFEEEIGTLYYDEFGLPIATDQLLCAGSKKCFDGVKALIKEICDMFPDSPYINIGGDEASIKLWNKCSECKKYMQENNISDEYELYSEYVGRVAEYVLSLGKTPMVWEGFPRKGSERIPKETIVIAWEALYNLPQNLIEDGFRIINSSWKPLYIVNELNLRFDTKDIMSWNVYLWQHWSKISKAFLNPITIAPTDRMIGSLFCSWQQTYEQEINYIMEYLAAASERTWSVERVCTDEDFMVKQQNIYNKLARMIQDR